jgi:hypothetical protein
MNGFLKGIRLRHFLDNVPDWHALVQGFSEVLCPGPPRWKVPSPNLLGEIMDEHHYYVFGRALGVIAWLVIAIIVKEVFF